MLLLKFTLLCISVKLKNLKANHNNLRKWIITCSVVYIRKVKKSESKSQLLILSLRLLVVVYIRKVKKSESKSQQSGYSRTERECCVYP